MAPPSETVTDTAPLSLTEWWARFDEEISELALKYPQLSDTPYFKAATQMIQAGLQTEHVSFFSLYSNKNALVRAESKFRLKITKKSPMHDETLDGYIPLIDSPCALFFAILCYKHLMRYDHVIAQGENAITLQWGFRGSKNNSKGECIVYHKPFTRDAALQLKTHIRDYIIENQDDVFFFLKKDHLAFNALKQQVNLSDDFFFDVEEELLDTQDTHNINALTQKITRYLQYHFNLMDASDPIESLSLLKGKIEDLKHQLDKIIIIKDLATTLLEQKEQGHTSIKLTELPLSDKAHTALQFLLTREERETLIKSQIVPKAKPKAVSHKKPSLTYRFVSSVTPQVLVDYMYPDKTPIQEGAKKVTSSPKDINWLINLLGEKLTKTAQSLSVRLTESTGNTVSFDKTDFTSHTQDTLTTISNGLASHVESLNQLQSTIDKYIKKHRTGIASFVDFTPIRMMTRFFHLIGMSRVLNDKYLLFRKARAFKKELIEIEEGLRAGNINKNTAQTTITALSIKLQDSAQSINQRSLYFRFFRQIRKENDEASAELCTLASETHKIMAAPAA